MSYKVGVITGAGEYHNPDPDPIKSLAYLIETTFTSASGIGLALAQSLSKKGWRLTLIDWNATAGDTLKQRIPNSSFHQADVSSYQNLSAAFATSWDRHRRLDFVFANAGVVPRRSFYEGFRTTTEPSFKPEDLVRAVNVNLLGVMMSSYLGLHYLRRTRLAAVSETETSLPPYRGGTIVATSSGAGLYPVRALPEYAASKHGIVGFIRSIAQEVYENEGGVRANCVCPGSILTPLTEEYIAKGFPRHFLTDIMSVTNAVETLVESDDYGTCVEVSGQDIVVQYPPVPKMESMRAALPLVSP